jgi:hypothetical protein
MGLVRVLTKHHYYATPSPRNWNKLSTAPLILPPEIITPSSCDDQKVSHTEYIQLSMQVQVNKRALE